MQLSSCAIVFAGEHNHGAIIKNVRSRIVVALVGSKNSKRQKKVRNYTDLG
jgi:hypothetical protein